MLKNHNHLMPFIIILMSNSISFLLSWIKKGLLITRSVGVICLSRYLQHLTLTGYQTLKHYNHLIPNIIVTRSLSQPHPTLQIPRHTRRPTGTIPCSQPGQSTGWIAPGSANSLNCRAVRFHCLRKTRLSAI